MKWYDWRTHTKRLEAWSKALQGNNPYSVEITTKMPLGVPAYTDFTHRVIKANPESFGSRPRDQYDFTKALLAHEAGHKRYTTPDASIGIVQARIANLLEDERIERLMEAEFVGVRKGLKLLNAECQKMAPSLDPDSSNVEDVLNYMLQERFSIRSGLPINGELSPDNRALWERCKPLVRECWTAATSETSNRNALEIMRILGLDKLSEAMDKLLSMMEKLEGERSSIDDAEEASGMESESAPSDTEGESTSKGTPKDDESGVPPLDGDHTPYDHGVGTKGHNFDPMPYNDVLKEAEPIAEKLAEVLRFEPKPDAFEPIERGGKFSLREYIRDDSTPFILQEDRPNPPTMAVRVIIDHSGSMGGRRGSCAWYAAVASMAVHLACTELEISHVVTVTPHDIRVADNTSGERGLALIAGTVNADQSYEDMGKTVQKHCEELMATPTDWRVVLAIHDGASNDKKLLNEVCRKYRDQIIILGVGIGRSVKGYEYELARDFGEDRLVICEDASILGESLVNMIRNVRGV